jgi:hypothetical protein
MTTLLRLHDNACLAVYELYSRKSSVRKRVNRASTLIALVNGIYGVSISIAIWPVVEHPSIIKLVSLGLIVTIYSNWVERRMSAQVEKWEDSMTPSRRRWWRVIILAYIGMAFVAPLVAAIFGRQS